jgi:hypothetical protein
MIPVEAHLVLNHIPEFGLVFGLVFFAVGLKRSSEATLLTSLRIFFALGIAAVPVVGSGLVSARVLAKAPWLDSQAVDKHQLAGLITFGGLVILGVLCGVVLSASSRNKRPLSAWVRKMIPLLAIAALGGKAHRTRLVTRRSGVQRYERSPIRANAGPPSPRAARPRRTPASWSQ